jgi:CHASE2 domain-containing sensor protein
MKELFDFAALIAPFVLAFCVTFFEAFVKSFQSRNIAQGHEWVSAGTSVLVTTTIFATFGLFLHSGWIVFVPSALGGAIGTFYSIRTHKRLFKKTKSVTLNPI